MTDIPAVIHIDTVADAQQDPTKEQPYRDLGLQDDEYEKITHILKRRPTESELVIYSVMWSEHCSYKSSRKYLRYFGETTTEDMKEGLLAGIGENAGVIDIGDGWAVTFKVESHNHPSYVEPFQGAATGVGGIVRDIIAMGARPIAVMDQLRFGPADAPDTARVVDGVVRGISHYGNCLGLPNLGGETVFDSSYAGNPLVNALCVGSLKSDQVHKAFASGTGNVIILFGALTGLDGIGGVSILASESFDDHHAPRKLPSVQVGDPFAEKLLIECCVELYEAGLVVGIQDLGGAGLSCAISELAAAGDGGMHIDLEKVPLRASHMTPPEILASESQERMCAVVAPHNVDAFMDICHKWETTATIIGHVTTTNKLEVSWNGEVIVDAPPSTIADESPVYDRPLHKPSYQDSINEDSSSKLSRPSVEQLRETALKLIASPALCSRRFIVEQYDRYVRGNTVQSQDADAGMLRIDENTGRGIAISTDASGRYTYLDPYQGAQLALAEAYRNVSVSGATPRAVTNCLNFGSPEDPGVMWQFQQAVYGLADGCKQLGIPVTGGNVSFYNQTGNQAILPTPVVGVLGVIDDVSRHTPTYFGSTPGEVLLVLGQTRDEFDGSIWAQVEHNHLGGQPPRVDLEAEKLLSQILVAASRDGLISSAHDLSEGGLWQAVVEATLASDVGCRLIIPPDVDPFVQLFSESTARVLVSVPRTELSRFQSMLEARNQHYTRIGVVAHTDTVEVQGVFTLELEEIRAAFEGTLPALFAHLQAKK